MSKLGHATLPDLLQSVNFTLVLMLTEDTWLREAASSLLGDAADPIEDPDQQIVGYNDSIYYNDISSGLFKK